jgi:hypothetical protein
MKKTKWMFALQAIPTVTTRRLAWVMYICTLIQTLWLLLIVAEYLELHVGMSTSYCSVMYEYELLQCYVWVWVTAVLCMSTSYCSVMYEYELLQCYAIIPYCQSCFSWVNNLWKFKKLGKYILLCLVCVVYIKWWQIYKVLPNIAVFVKVKKVRIFYSPCTVKSAILFLLE